MADVICRVLTRTASYHPERDGKVFSQRGASIAIEFYFPETFFTAMPNNLEAALNPRSVAIVGASDNPHKVGGRPILFMKQYGYRGKVFPVNPARAEVQGYPAYADLDSLPEVPEMAIVALAGEGTVQAVAQCARMGVKVAVIMASGFGETGADGKKIQDAMLAQARAAGMRIVGPNSQGLANFGTGAIANFSTIFNDLPRIVGPAAIISQSGALSQLIYTLLHQRGIGVRHCHATGNEADITVAELATQVAQDPEVKLLLLYLETVNDPDKLAEAAAIARGRDLPLLGLKSGRTLSGQRAASSHTGAMATEDRVVDAFLRHHAIWRAIDPHDLVNAAELYLKGWRPQGRRLVAVSNSGATCVMAADMAEEFQLPLAVLADATRTQLNAVLPGFATTTNPIDITGALLSDNSLFGKILDIVGKDAGVDLFFAGIPIAGTGYDVAAFARDAASFIATTGKPLALAVPQDEVAAPFVKLRVPVFPSDRMALRALDQLAAHSAMMRRERKTAAAAPVHIALTKGGKPFLNEADSLALLAANGIAVAPQRLCRSAAEAREAWRALGGLVAVKACSAEVPHKSEFGLVALNLDSEDAVGAAFDAQWRKLAQMQVARDGIIVAAMVKCQRELALGARVDARFGPVVMVGDGGKYVEALQDFILLIPPFDTDEVIEALDRLHIAPVLRGVRGEPPLDLDAVAAIAVRLGKIMQAGRGRIASIDLNPVMVRAKGEGAVVADTLVELIQV
jgi:acyl-CoA synthetase (NDP forming)